jgi:ribosomal protein L16/L10AE
VQVKAGDKLVMLKVSSANFDIAKAALKRFASKISTPISIIAA